MHPRLLHRARDPGTWIVAAPVLLAALIVVVRAAVQSITIDEASAYQAYVQQAGSGGLWAAEAANHVLYSLLEWVAVSLFGVHVFVIRLPALLGAGLYLGSALWLCRMLIRGAWSRIVLLTAFCLNPLILDYLVAARGYSLALGFLLLATALFVRTLLRPRDLEFTSRDYRRLALASAALGLTVSANFAFAVVSAVLGTVFLALLYADRRIGPVHRGGAVLATTVPGIVALGVTCGYTLAHWPPDQFVYGATTIGGLMRSVVNPSLHTPNPSVLPSGLLTLFRRLADAVPYVLAGAALLTILALAVRSLPREARGPLPATRLVALMGVATVLVAILIHAILRAGFGTRLPEARTASWVVPLSLLVLAACIADQPRLRLDWFRGGGQRLAKSGDGLGLVTVVVSLLALVELSCVRFSYFEEWQFDSDTANGYAVLAREAARLHVVQPVVDWHFNSSFTFYREQQPHPPVQDLNGVTSYPSGQRLYALYEPTGAAFIAHDHLVPVYRDPLSGLVIAEDRASAADA